MIEGNRSEGDLSVGAAQALVLDEVLRIAPEVDAATIDRAADLRRAADLDSLDFQTLVEAIAARTGVVVPEADYPRCRSLQGLAEYIRVKRG